jgi:nucleoside-diphosphate-sugar epimerase
MRILITGGTGFLGTNLQKELESRGHEVTVFGRDLDLSSLQATIGKFRSANPEIIIHAAAVCGGIGANRKKPGTFFAENARMNLNAVDAASILAEFGMIKKFVGLGSVCSYPKYTPVPFKEEELWNGYPEETNAPYGIAKKLLMMHIQTYREQYGFPGIFLIPVNLYGPCFTEDTDIMTTNGIKNIKDLEVGDSVYTLNKENFDVEISKITHTHRFYTNELFSFKSKGADFLVTPEHKMFCRTNTGFQKKPADWFRKRCGKSGQTTFAHHNPIMKGDGHPNLLTNVQVTLENYTDFSHKFYKVGRKKFVRDFPHSSSKKIPLCYNSIDFCSFLGWYISEGSFSTIQRTNKSFQIKIAQENRDYVSVISDLLSRMDIPFGYNGKTFYFSSRVWKNYIEQNVGVYSENKRIPKKVFEMGFQERLALFSSMMGGDGNSSGKRYTTKSEALANDFIHLCFTIGKKASKKYDHESKCWRIYIRTIRENVTVKYKNISVVPLSIETYCITTSKNNIIYAGRNSKFNWIGQCDHFGLENSHVIPALIRKFDYAKENSSDVELWGTGSASREFLYVKDAARGIADAAEKYDGPEPVNLGAGFEITIKDLAELTAKLIGYEGKINWNTEMPDGQPRRCLDVSRAKKYFGFEAKTQFKDGLAETIDWYRNNREEILKEQ